MAILLVWLGVVAFFRWLNEGPLVGNSIYFLLVLLGVLGFGRDKLLQDRISRLERDQGRPSQE